METNAVVNARDWVHVLKNAASQPGTTEALDNLLDRLYAGPARIRLDVVQDLLKTPDDLGLRVLAALATRHADPETNVRWSIADGLGRVGQSEAKGLLERLAQSDDDESVRSRAAAALGEQALARYETQVGPEKAAPQVLVKTRGVVRARGGSPVRQASKEAQDILETLYRLKDKEPSDYVRGVIDLTLRQLGE